MIKFKTVLLLILFSITSSSFGQLRVGYFDVTMYTHKNLKKKDLNRFTEKTTTFVLPNFYPKPLYNEVIKDVWTVTPFQLVMEDEFDEATVKEEDALAHFMNIGVTKTTSSGMKVDYSYHIIDFYVVDKIKKRPKKGQMNWSSSKIGAIYFTADVELRKQAGAYANELNGDLLNFRLGYLKNYLQFMNHSIKNSITVDLYDDYTKPELKKLNTNTLYIDKTFLYGYNAFTVKQKDAPEIEDLTEDYSFDYKVVEYEKIEEMILDNDAPDFYYLMYNQINSNKIITVINGKTGDIIYQQHTTMSYNIKPKDFKALDKKIEKMK